MMTLFVYIIPKDKYVTKARRKQKKLADLSNRKSLLLMNTLCVYLGREREREREKKSRHNTILVDSTLVLFNDSSGSDEK